MSSRHKKKASTLHLPGKTFSATEEEYIIDLKESQNPPLDWTELTERFNNRFPTSRRSKGGLQVHYSRSLQPGAGRRPSSRPTRRPAAIRGAHTAEATTTNTGDARGSDTEEADFANQLTLSNTGEHPSIGSRSRANIEQGEQPSKFFEEVANICETGERRVKSRQKYVNSQPTDTSEQEANTTSLESELTDTSGKQQESNGLTDTGIKNMVADTAIVHRKIKLVFGSRSQSSVESQPEQPKEQPKKRTHKRKQDIDDTEAVAPAKKKRTVDDTEVVAPTKKKRTVDDTEIVAPTKKKRTVDDTEIVAPTKKKRKVDDTEVIAPTKKKRTVNDTEAVAPTKKKPALDDTEAVSSTKRKRKVIEIDDTEVVAPPAAAPPRPPMHIESFWEMCVVGHYQWERQRALNPHMQGPFKYPPPNRVLEFSTRNGSFRLRLRQVGDPPHELTGGGPVYVPDVADRPPGVSVPLWSPPDAQQPNAQQPNAEEPNTNPPNISPPNTNPPNTHPPNGRPSAPRLWNRINPAPASDSPPEGSSSGKMPHTSEEDDDIVSPESEA